LSTSPAPGQDPGTNPYGLPLYPGPPPAPPGKKLGAAAIVGIVFAVLVSLGVGSLAAVGFFRVVESVAVPKVGDCLHITADSSENSDFEKLPCQDRRAMYLVEQRTNGSSACAGADYTRFRIYDDKSDRLTLCLVLNVTSGDCLGSVEDLVDIAKVGCTSGQAQAKVVVHAGVADEDSCDAADAIALVYQGPPVRTVCLLDPGESI